MYLDLNTWHMYGDMCYARHVCLPQVVGALAAAALLQMDGVAGEKHLHWAFA